VVELLAVQSTFTVRFIKHKLGTPISQIGRGIYNRVWGRIGHVLLFLALLRLQTRTNPFYLLRIIWGRVTPPQIILINPNLSRHRHDRISEMWNLDGSSC